MSPGEWKLVTDMSELRAGMTCKVDPCPKCGSKHVLTVAERLAGGGVRFVEVVHSQTHRFGPSALSDDADGVYRRNLFRLIARCEVAGCGETPKIADGHLRCAVHFPAVVR